INRLSIAQSLAAKLKLLTCAHKNKITIRLGHLLQSLQSQEGQASFCFAHPSVFNWILPA
ncbi:hypothetical protein HN51_026028, partial [Arachis hypogaea]